MEELSQGNFSNAFSNIGSAIKGGVQGTIQTSAGVSQMGGSLVPAALLSAGSLLGYGLYRKIKGMSAVKKLT